MRKIITLSLALAVSGCATAPPILTRFDGGTLAPVVVEQATAECWSKAQVAKLNVPRAFTIGGAVVRGVWEQQEVERQAFNACMAEKGMRATWKDV